MNKKEKDIISILERSANGLKAKDLAKLLNIDKTELNAILYNSLKDKYLYLDPEYVWHSFNLKAVRETIAKENELPKNFHKKWTKQEKEKLMEEYISGMPMINIADKHKRTELAIAMMVTQIINEKND